MKKSHHEIVDEMTRVSARMNELGAMERTPENTGEFERLNAEFNDLNRQAAAARASEQVVELAMELGRPQPRITDSAPSTTQPRFTSGGTSLPLTAPTSVISAFGGYAKTGKIVASLSIGSDPDGGYEVPKELDRELQVVAANQSAILKVCKTVSGVTDAYCQNIVTGAPASGWVAEAGNRAATNTPTITQIPFFRGGLYANASATNWMLQDGAHEVGAWLTQEIGRAFGAAIATALTTGDGTDKPKGITVYTHAAVPAFGQIKIVGGGEAAKVTLDGCENALSALHPEYQGDAVFIMSPTAASQLRQQKAVGGGGFMWSPDAREGTPPTLFGKTVLIDPTLPAVAANSTSVYVAAWQRAYTFVRYGQPIVVRDNVTSKGNTLFYLEQRCGGALTDSNAIVCHKTMA